VEKNGRKYMWVITVRTTIENWLAFQPIDARLHLFMTGLNRSLQLMHSLLKRQRLPDFSYLLHALLTVREQKRDVSRPK